MTLRILSYNIHKGFSASSFNFVLDKIRDSIRRVDADIVFLQEVLGHHESKRSKIPDWPTQTQFEFIAHEAWDHHAYGKNAVYTSGHHGNAILSKYPITRWENVDISTNRLERRGLLHAVVQFPETKKELHAICLHLGLFETARKRQIQSLVKQIKSMVPAGSPLIVAGDFNDWSEKATPVLEQALNLKEAFLEVHQDHAKTFPSWLPALKLDRIYVRNLVPTSAKTMTGSPWSELSDHIAILAETMMGED